MEYEYNGEKITVEEHEREINLDPDMLEDTMDLKEQLQNKEDELEDTIIEDKDEFYG